MSRPEEQPVEETIGVAQRIPGRKNHPIPLITLFFLCMAVYWLPRFPVFFLSGIPDPWFLPIYGSVKILVTLPVIWLLRQETDRPSWEEMGVSTKGAQYFVVFGLLLMAFTLVITVLYSTGLGALGITSKGEAREYSWDGVLWSTLLGPFWEELIYRVMALTLLARRFTHVQASFMVAVWFVGKHFLAWYGDDPSWAYVFFYILLRTLVWGFVDLLYLRYRSLVLSTSFHLGWNSLVVLWSFLTADQAWLFSPILLAFCFFFISQCHHMLNFLDVFTGRRNQPFQGILDPYQRAFSCLRELVPERLSRGYLLALLFALSLMFLTEPLQIVTGQSLELWLGRFVFLLGLLYLFFIYLGPNHLSARQIEEGDFSTLRPVYYTKEQGVDWVPKIWHRLRPL